MIRATCLALALLSGCSSSRVAQGSRAHAFGATSVVTGAGGGVATIIAGVLVATAEADADPRTGRAVESDVAVEPFAAAAIASAALIGIGIGLLVYGDSLIDGTAEDLDRPEETPVGLDWRARLPPTKTSTSR